MVAALVGSAAAVVAAVLGYLGVRAAGQGPLHVADVEGLSALVDRLQEEREYWQHRAEECERRTAG